MEKLHPCLSSKIRYNLKTCFTRRNAQHATTSDQLMYIILNHYNLINLEPLQQAKIIIKDYDDLKLYSLMLQTLP